MTGAAAGCPRSSDRSGACTDLVNPDHDAREARPQWCTATTPLDIVPAPTGSAFSLWRLPGAKSLAVNARQDLVLAAATRGGVLNLTVNAGLLLGDAYAFLVPSLTEPDDAAHAMTRVRSAMQGSAALLPARAPSRVGRAALVTSRARAVTQQQWHRLPSTVACVRRADSPDRLRPYAPAANRPCPNALCRRRQYLGRANGGGSCLNSCLNFDRGASR